MILGIDVGATKTLLGLFNNRDELERTQKSLTREDYHDFVESLAKDIVAFVQDEPIDTICIAMPGMIDRKQGSVVAMGHRPWKNIAIVKDLQAKLPFKAKFILENDAKLAGLGEAVSYDANKYPTIVYVTISTGIGTAIITKGQLDPEFVNDEGGFILLPHEGKLEYWDYVASGAAFEKKYGALASDTDDPAIWQEFVQLLAPGFSAIRALLTPDLVITGGGLGTQLEKFKAPLIELISRPGNPNAKIPEFAVAQHDGNSVLFGCQALAKQHNAAA